jgi:hypothetical protein
VIKDFQRGWVAERLNAPVLKTGMGESPSWVRIPPHPPFSIIYNPHYCSFLNDLSLFLWDNMGSSRHKSDALSIAIHSSLRYNVGVVVGFIKHGFGKST